MTIGIKYCGGCNPRYDRVAAISGFKEKYPEYNFLPADAGTHYDYALVICGCPSACADHSMIIADGQKFILSQEKDWDRIGVFFQNLPQ